MFALVWDFFLLITQVILILVFLGFTITSSVLIWRAIHFHRDAANKGATVVGNSYARSSFVTLLGALLTVFAIKKISESRRRRRQARKKRST